MAELGAGPQAARLLIEDRPGAGPGELARRARDMEGLRLVVVDGLRAVPGPWWPVRDGQAGAGPERKLQRLARDLNVPVLAGAEPGDRNVGDLRAALAPDVTLDLALAADETGPHARQGLVRVRVAECALGLRREAEIRTDLPRARLVGPEFRPDPVFGTDEGRLVVDALTASAQDPLETPGAMPGNLLRRLAQLSRGMLETFSGLEFGDLPHEAQHAVLQEWAGRPPLPDPVPGRRPGTALGVFYAHAVAHGYAPEAEVSPGPRARPGTGRR
ncbi:hypothetical protein ACFYZN_25610 [Streptomyces sp. NPDC001777]|uniref:hypothetical protein n=1 Tax=Streptomyces sp. NPDC001777 TaxID=3364608 RepID=UPI0036C465A8